MNSINGLDVVGTVDNCMNTVDILASYAFINCIQAEILQCEITGRSNSDGACDH